MGYEEYQENNKKSLKVKLIISLILVLLVILSVILVNVYLEIVQLDEMGGFSIIFKKNFYYNVIFTSIGTVLIFILFFISNVFIRKNIRDYQKENNFEIKKYPNLRLVFLVSLVGAILTKDFFGQKVLMYLNKESFNKIDPIFNVDLSYYIFERPFYMSFYQFISLLWLSVIIYTIIYYVAAFFTMASKINFDELNIKKIIRHNLINVAIFFVIKAFSYKFQQEGILYSNFSGIDGAGTVDHLIWLNYYKIAPFISVIIVLAAFVFIWKGKLKQAIYTIAVFPAIWIMVTLGAFFFQLTVKTNEFQTEKKYIQYNMENTREAYNLTKLESYDVDNIAELNQEIINNNSETINNLRVVSIESSIEALKQKANYNTYYSFKNGDLDVYNIKGKLTPCIVSARELDKQKIDSKYVNRVFSYTHGYGAVFSSINNLKEGGTDLFTKDLDMKTPIEVSPVNEKRIYYGEMTNDYVIVNGKDVKEKDYDGKTETVYTGMGGINLGIFKRMMFAMKFGDFNILVSDNIGPNSKILLNREIVSRARRAVPFLGVDSDPYLVATSDGRLKWVLDGYTTTNFYPYSQQNEDYHINYIRNSVKIVIDAYDGNVKYYIIDKTDPIINTYKKAYPGIFCEEPLPEDIASHMRYPKFLFELQCEILARYHLNPSNIEDVQLFYNNSSEVREIAKYSESKGKGILGYESKNIKKCEPYYCYMGMPFSNEKRPELLLMQIFTPEKSHKLQCIAFAKNSPDEYGKIVLYNYSKDLNILGPFNADEKINKIDVIKDLYNKSQGSYQVFKSDIQVVPVDKSFLYVQSVYTQSNGQNTIPELKYVVVGYQKGDDLKYGVGKDLKTALERIFTDPSTWKDLYVPDKNAVLSGTLTPLPKTTNTISVSAFPSVSGRVSNQPTNVPTGEIKDDKKKDEKLEQLITKYDELKKQIDEIEKLINELKESEQKK